MMDKVKKFFTNLIFEDDGGENKKETPQNVKEETDAEKPPFMQNDPVVEIKLDEINAAQQPAASFISQNTPTPAEKPAAVPVEKQPVSKPAAPQPQHSVSMDIEINRKPVAPQDELQQLISEIQHPKETIKYKPRPVISPIFGAQGADTDNFRKPEQREFLNSSLKSNVISPISGKETLTIIKEDQIDEKIAVMTTSDFVDEIVVEKPVPNVYQSVPSFTLPTPEEVQNPTSDSEGNVTEQNEQISLF